jgi:Ni/Co efflux regulator RcnB
MKLLGAVLVLAMTPFFATAQTAEQTTDASQTESQPVARASSHDRHHSRHKRARHHHRKVAKHHTQRPS